VSKIVFGIEPNADEHVFIALRRFISAFGQDEVVALFPSIIVWHVFMNV
jgi:hypothetical protein